MVVVVVAEAAEEGAENASAPVLLEAAVGLGDWRRQEPEGTEDAWTR